MLSATTATPSDYWLLRDMVNLRVAGHLTLTPKGKTKEWNKPHDTNDTHKKW